MEGRRLTTHWGGESIKLNMAEQWEGEHGYAPKNHNHDSKYAKLGHTHDGIGDLPAHNHDDRYSKLGHNHDTVYSKTSHNHDTVYSKLGHNHDDKYIAKTTGAYIVASWRNGANWYRKWSDNTLEQGGIVKTPNNTSGDTTISFNLQFADTNYKVLFTCGGSISESGTRYRHYVRNKTVSDCIVEDHMLSLQCDWVEWMAIDTYS